MSYDAFNYRFSIKMEGKNKRQKQIAQDAHVDATVEKIKADFDLQEVSTLGDLRSTAKTLLRKQIK